MLGRFLSPDTIIPNPTNPQLFNRYSYAGNNPILYNDPDGHCGPLCVIALIIFFAGVGFEMTASNPMPPEVRPPPEQNIVGYGLMGGGALLKFAPALFAGPGLECLNNPNCGEKTTKSIDGLCAEGRCESAVQQATKALESAVDTANKLGNTSDAALGINDNGQLFGFARQTQSYWYGEWGDVGLTDRPVSSFSFGPSFQQAMDRAGNIKFNLDGIRGDPVDFARLGGTGDWGDVPWPARELYLIWQNPEWLAKTIFYKDGQVVSSPFDPQ